MKKLSILFIVLGLNSCSTDDSESNITADIIGAWEAVSVNATGTVVTTIQGVTVETDYTGEVYDMDSTLAFSETPNNVIAGGTFSVRVAGEIGEDPFEYSKANLEYLGNGTWDVIGSELKVTTASKTAVAKIKALTESRLVLIIKEEVELSEEDLEVLPEEGITSVIATVNIECTFKR